MNAEAKYNRLIEEIEEAVSLPHAASPAEIAEALSAASGISVRDLGSIFRFLSSKSLIAYIKERQIMQAYRCIVRQEDFDWLEAIDYTALGEQSAFIRAFKRTLDMTPGEAFERRAEDHFRPPLRWERLSASGLDETPEEETEDPSMDAEKIFGLDAQAYKEAELAADYQKLFAFNRLEGEFAFGLYKRFKGWGFDMRSAFEYVDELNDIARPAYNEEHKEGRAFQKRVEELVDAFAGYYLFRTYCEMPVSELGELRREFEIMGLEDDNIPLPLVRAYAHGEIDCTDFPEVAAFVEKHDEEIEDLERFIMNYRLMGLEEALNCEKDFQDPDFVVKICESAMRSLQEEIESCGVPDAYADYDGYYEDEHYRPREIKMDFDMDNIAYEEDDDFYDF